MSIKELITKEPITVSYSSSIKDAAKLMRKYNVGSLLVIRDGNAVGIVTERDIIQAISDDIELNESVSRIMSTNLITAESTMDEGDAALLMVNKKIRHLVVTENGKIIGVISLRDIAKILGLETTDTSIW
ncbi:CBS domain-containing protein [Acidianus sulfidivorans JP7]|uniref:Histidine kinase n=1 Tax=Acidianus sulfidivorans JP7 TaxID=619593 RepID=A0A2U9IKJ7_9CREN|nr:CBS domain-containing protein [Acidianus sulfidivorans]AWR96567.1 CBS domain-containing protein [Acidianus sulfidivorans JP7]